MITYDRFTLDNGLKVIVHNDDATPFVAVNLLYDVGARDEQADKTGFAHLFEHLMFGGSANIPSYDTPLQLVGGENNAFTSNDITNYYVTVPKQNIETAFWLESDRMLSLAFSEKSLEVQRGVVIEEFKQRYLNQPYGDVWLMLRPLAYQNHPYQWPTIGKEVAHIEQATMDDVKQFFYAHYAPNNCILTVAGNVTTDEVKRLADKWFGPIERRNVPERNLPVEPVQTEARHLEVVRDVPYDSIYKVYHMCGRRDKAYYATDLISDILSSGASSRLYQSLVQEQNIFSNIDAYIMGSLDPGMFVVSGQLLEGKSFEEAEAGIKAELDKLTQEGPGAYELEKVQNKVEASHTFSEISQLNKAMSLAYHELLGDANGVNQEAARYCAVTAEQIKATAATLFNPNNCSTLYYKAGKQ